MSWADDDDRLWQELQEATRQGGAVPPDHLTAARAAFTWRTVDAELLALTEEAAAVGAAVRGAETTERRVLEFRGAEVTIALELAGDHAEGQLLPAGAAGYRLSKATVEGETEEVEVDASGYFSFPVRDRDTFRLRLEVDGAAHVTEWVTA
jgi:hypothetical protein